MSRISENELRKNFPHLLKELEEGPSTEGKPVKMKVDKGRGYEPSVLDFLKRCDNEKEALEVIDYFERREKITKAYAANIRTQIKEKGVRSFGEKRRPGHYFKEFG
jgi:hypothetical protein